MGLDLIVLLVGVLYDVWVELGLSVMIMLLRWVWLGCDLSRSVLR